MLALILLINVQKSHAGAGASIFGVFLIQQAIAEADKNIGEACQVDLGMVLSPYLRTGPPQEATACAANTITIGALSVATYYASKATMSLVMSPLAADIAAQVSAIGTAIGLINTYYAVSMRSNILKVCDDTNFGGNGEKTYHPFAYNDDAIANIISVSQGKRKNSVTRDEIVDKYQKICIQRSDNSKLNDVRWLQANECTTVAGIMFCAYRYKGDRNVLCVRSSSTCPCRKPINNGTEREPDLQYNTDGVAQNKDGTYALSSGDTERFLKHCRMLRSADVFKDDFNKKYEVVDPACMNFAGNSKNDTGFRLSAPAAECVIGTMRNLFEKRITPIRGMSEISTQTQNNINALSDDKNAIIDIANKIKPFIQSTDIASQVQNLNANAAFIDLVAKLNTLKNGAADARFKAGLTSFGGQIDLLQYQTYIAGLASIPNDMFRIPMPQMDTAGYIYSATQTYNALIKTTYLIDAVISASITQTTSDEVTTMYGVFQGSLKYIIILCLVIYVFIIGYKLIMGDMEFKTNEAIQQFIKIGLVVYFAIGTGWQDYGLSLITRSSQGIATFMASMLNVTSGDQCTQKFDFFEADNSLVRDIISYQAGLKSGYIPVLNGAYPTDGTQMTQAQKDDLDNVCRYGQGRVFGQYTTNGVLKLYCKRGIPFPRPNYEYPMIPVKMTKDMTNKYSILHLNYSTIYNNADFFPIPVRCVNSKMQQLYCSDKSCSGIVDVNQNPNNIYYPKMIKKGGVNVFACDKRIGNTTEYGYVADGYNINDLQDTGAVPFNVNISIPSNSIIRTGYYFGTYTGGYTKLTINGEKDDMYARLNKINTINQLDQYRGTINKAYKGYPVIQTDVGSTRDLSYLAIFDTLDCKIGKYIMAQNGSVLPKLIGISFSIAFSSLFGIATAIAIVTFVLMIILVVAKMAQNFIVGMSALMILAYLAPIAIPMSLFDMTKSMFDKWKENIQSYIIYPPISFISVIIVMKIMDIVMYGDFSTGTIAPDGLFDANGNINTATCAQGAKTFDDLKSKPYMCLITIVSQKYSWAPWLFFGLLFMPMVGWAAIGATMLATSAIMTAAEGALSTVLLYKAVIALVAIAMTSDLIDKIEGSLGDIFGKADVGIANGLSSVSSMLSSEKIGAAYAGGIAKAGAITRSGARGTALSGLNKRAGNKEEKDLRKKNQ